MDEITNAINTFFNSLKCENILHYNIQNTSYPFENVFVLTCLSPRHVEACSDDFQKFVKDNKDQFFGELAQKTKNNKIFAIDGTKTDGWVVVELKNKGIVAHFFTEEARKIYNIETHLERMKQIVISTNN